MAARVAEASVEEIKAGFRINWMSMSDANSGESLWKSASEDWDPAKLWTEELVARVPASILRCETVARDMNFSSRSVIRDFRLVQKIYLSDQPLEEWNFKFGFVIPGSTNTWSSVIEAAGGDQMIPPEVLSGNVVIETAFFDGDRAVATCRLRLFYV